MRSIAARLAALLASATGNEARTTETEGRIRIEVDIPEELSESAATAVLSALRTAERFGYERAGGRAYVWATFGERHGEDVDVNAPSPKPPAKGGERT